MMKSVLISTSAVLAAAECQGGKACLSMAVAQPQRLADPQSETAEADPVLSINTFTAVDQCATSEVRDLTSWVLAYYEDVSNQLDTSFSNILTTARLANSALRYLGALSGELQAFQRIQSISTEMNAMLRTCMADAMHLSASMERCDMSFSSESFGVDSLSAETQEGAESVWIHPVSVSTKGTCLAEACSHMTAWNQTCGHEGFAGDLEAIASAHDLEGSKYAFQANREVSFTRPVSSLYTQADDASTFAVMNEDLFTQEYALLTRVNLWIEVQFHGMMVMVRKSLNGGQFAGTNDLEVCGALGYPVEHASWISLAFDKCEGSLVKHWLKVNPSNRQYMKQLVSTLADKIPNVIKPGAPGVLFAGRLTNICKKFQDLEPEIQVEMERLQQQQLAMEAQHSGQPAPAFGAEPTDNLPLMP